MKKLLVLTFLLSASIYSYAQVSAGVKGGLNVSNLSSDADVTYDSRTGYHVGAYVRLQFANLALQPELLYSQTGTEIDFGGATADFEQDFTYLTLPVMLKFYLVKGVNIHAGPQLGFLMSADGTYQAPDGTTTKFSRDSYRDADISGAVGAGWDTPFGLNLAVRYLFGLNDVSNSSLLGGDTKTRTFQISAGFRLFGD